MRPALPGQDRRVLAVRALLEQGAGVLLRRRLDQSEQERRDKDRQLTAVLTDQRPKDEAPGPNAGRGFWVRLRRKT